MSINLKTQKMLWGRAAGRCSNPNCRIDLYEDETETDDPTLVGENCHIVAESDGGPRSNASMPIEKRNNYANLILLCRNHHKIIDSQENEFTVERLQTMKREHEYWVKSQLGIDEDRQFEIEQYAEIIDQWERLADANNWKGWSSFILSHDQPALHSDQHQRLKELRGWLLNRVWPGRFLNIEAAFSNFLLILQDFQKTFEAHATSQNDPEVIRTERFYKINEWDEDRYFKLVNSYEFHVYLVMDLMLELTRAANLICDSVRKDLFRSYRLSEGRFVVQSGPHSDLSFHDMIPRYKERDMQGEMPYPGLSDFLTRRTERDFYFGK